MEIVKMMGSKLTNEERETLLNYDYTTKRWLMDSTVMKHVNRAINRGWMPLKQYIYEDGTVFGMMLEAPERAVTIRSVEKKQLSEKQMINLNKEEKDDGC